MWTSCYYCYFLCWFPIVLSKYYESKTIFLEETVLQQSFKCGEKPNGFYTFIEDDCLVYYVCKSKNVNAGQRLTSTHLCPPATRFDLKSKECKAWDQVECKTDFATLGSKGSFKMDKKSSKSRKKRAIIRQSYINKQEINNIPHNCYWCCKPSSTRPENQVHHDYFSTTTTARPTTTTTQFWWYPSTTTQRPLTTPFWWRPTASKPATFQQPEIIEAKTKKLNRFSSTSANHGFSSAYDVLLKFKRFHGKIDNQIKDDFVVIEDNYNPEVIEAVVVKK